MIYILLLLLCETVAAAVRVHVIKSQKDAQYRIYVYLIFINRRHGAYHIIIDNSYESRYTPRHIQYIIIIIIIRVPIITHIYIIHVLYYIL